VRLDAGQSACVDASAPETAGFDGSQERDLSLPKPLKSAILRLKSLGIWRTSVESGERRLNLANVG